MYCFESFQCSRMECPVRLGLVRRCWTYFEKLGIEVTVEECPYAPCSRCHYRMGWEIGLLGDSLFPEEPPPASETYLSLLLDPGPKNQLEPALPAHPNLPDFIPGPEFPRPRPISPELPPSLPPPALRPPPPPSPSPEIPAELSFDLEKVGAPGLRFCWEVIPCTNPRCPVRERQIIRCFKFFEPRGEAKKLEITCGEWSCQECHYKLGWDMGIINEGLFGDILEKKRMQRTKDDRIKRQGLVDLYLNELAKKPLSRDEELDLAKKIAGDKDAAELFLMANLKLVVRIAGNFSNRGLNIMDLIQEGNIGLIKAISKFDWTLGYRFSTYAAYWVRHYMQQAISAQARTIRVPHHLLAIAHKIKRTISELQAQTQRAPTLKELSAHLMIEEDKILDVLRLSETPISIEAKPGGDGDDDQTSPEYFLADKAQLSPEEVALENAKAEACRKALDLLPDRLRMIAEYFFGFRDEQLSLAEIGRRMGISRERARQLLAQALEELKLHEFVANMKDFL